MHTSIIIYVYIFYLCKCISILFYWYSAICISINISVYISVYIRAFAVHVIFNYGADTFTKMLLIYESFLRIFDR